MSIRTISVPLPSGVPSSAAREACGNLFWAAEGITNVRLSDEDVQIEYSGQADDTAVAELVASALAALLAGGLDIAPTTVAETRFELRSAAADPIHDLVAEGWLSFDAQGSAVYSGLLARLFGSLDRFFATAATDLGASEIHLPVLVSVDTLVRSGYLASHGNQAHFAFHLREGQNVVERFRDGCLPGKPIDMTSLPTTAISPDAVLNPAVCQPYYRSLADVELDRELLVTGCGRCFRYESGATEGLRRLREFSVRELIGVGSSFGIDSLRSRFLGVAVKMLQELHIEASVITASDPFFIDTHSNQSAYQMAFELKHEVRATLPFDGSTLAIASVNHHQQHFGRAWQIREPGGDIASSCCMGFGLDRWCYTIFAQYGLNPTDWPPALRALVEER